MRIHSLLFAPLLIAAAACGSDDNNGNNGTNNGANNGAAETCKFDTTLSGAVEETVAWNDAQGCGAASSGTLLTFTFGAFADESIVVGTSGEAGMTASGIDAYVTYRNADGAEWTTSDCTVDITRNELVDSDPEFGDTYALEGSGSCTTAADARAGGASGELTVGDFEFGVEVPF